MSVVRHTVDTFMFRWVAFTVFYGVWAGTQWAGNFTSAVRCPVVKLRAFETSGCRDIVICLTNLPSYFYFSVKNSPPSVCSHLYYCVTILSLGDLDEFRCDAPFCQVDFWVLGYYCVLNISLLVRF